MVYGIWLLIVSFFQMPVIVWKSTRVQLEALAQKDQLNLDATGSPCMTWVAFAGTAFISILNVVIIVLAVAGGIYNLFSGMFGSLGFTAGLGRMIYFPILGYVLAVLTTWILGFWFEWIILAINIANDIRALRVHSVPDEEMFKTPPE